MNQAQGIICGGAVRLAPEYPMTVLQCLVQRSPYGSGPTAPAPGGLQTRIEPDGLVKITRRAIVFFRFQVGLGTIGECLTVFRLELDRLIKSLDRTVIFALSQVSDTTV